MRLRSALPVARPSTTPSTVTDPLVGAISPASIRIVVVLPAPLGPSSATISPRATSKLTSSTAMREPKRRVRRTRGDHRRPRVELVESRRHQQLAPGAEEERGGRQCAGAAELDRADLVAVAVVDVGIRDRERHPEVAVAIDGGRADRRPDERQLAVCRLPSSARSSAASSTKCVDLAAFDVPLEHERARRVVLPEHRLAGLEDEEEAAGRIDERQAAVEREVQLAIVLLTGAPQVAERPVRRRRASVYSVMSAARSPAATSGSTCRCTAAMPMPFSTKLSMEMRGLRPAGQREAADRKPTGVKIWMRSRPSGRVGDDERAVRRDGERRRIDDPARPRRRSGRSPRSSSARRRCRSTACARRSKTKYWPDADC